MKVQNTGTEPKSRHGFEYVKRVALSGPGKLVLAVAVMGCLMSIPAPLPAER